MSPRAVGRFGLADRDDTALEEQLSPQTGEHRRLDEATNSATTSAAPPYRPSPDGLPGNAGEGAIEDRGQRARSGLRSGLTRIAAGRGLVATWTTGEAMASCSVSAVLPQ